MTTKVELSCPFGHTCEKHIVDDNGQIIETNRCRLYIKLAGQNPQTGEQMDEWNCSIPWSVIMLVENANTNRGQTAALESFRNEAVQGQQIFNTLIAQSIQHRLNKD
ncbi:MAG: hypothetical protein ACXW2E_00875 [Nitrososphaeraceae archaeon]